MPPTPPILWGIWARSWLVGSDCSAGPCSRRDIGDTWGWAGRRRDRGEVGSGKGKGRCSTGEEQEEVGRSLGTTQLGERFFPGGAGLGSRGRGQASEPDPPVASQGPPKSFPSQFRPAYRPGWAPT